MTKTVIYADILVFVNTAVDFFILLFTEKLIKTKTKPARLVLGSFVCGLTSLCIFLPPMNIILQFVLRILISFITVGVSFKISKWRTFLRANICFFTATLLYAALMYAVYFAIHPINLEMRNGVAFINISPIVMILSSTACYIVLSVTNRIFIRRNNNCERCKITLCNNDNTVNTTAIIDTGNAVSDIIGENKVAVADKRVFSKLFPEYKETDIADIPGNYLGIRLIPVKTVSGTALLNAFKCDYVIVNGEKINKPLIALSKEKLDDDYSVIIGSDFVN